MASNSAWVYIGAPFVLVFRVLTLLLSLILYILWLIWQPVSYILIRPITTLLYLLALPVLTFAGWISALLDRILYFLRGFETLYVYFGAAALLGLVTGLLLFAISTGLSKLLNLNPPPKNDRPPQKVRSVEEYRADRERKRELRRLGGDPLTLDFSSSTSSSNLIEGKERGLRKWTDRGLQSPTTILEEEDSDG